MKTHLQMALAAALFLASCKKEESTVVTPVLSREEAQAPVTGITVHRNGIAYTQLNQELAYNKFITIDVDQNGKNDFYFTSVLVYDGESHLFLNASPVGSSGGKMLLDNREDLVMNTQWGVPLSAGTVVSAQTLSWQSWSNYLTKGTLLDAIDHNPLPYTFKGPWVAVSNRYLGMQVNINGQKHYGWIAFSHKAGETKMTITGFAYQLSAGQAIIAGETSN